ncbi:hypothetical protein SAMCFNEI73_Ch0613 [Sinorhizobium americanum]|uniref:Uncharacterized protein n=1 Tax=Sinorhizobium americanum TaxID=194963 RepID=A0A1L3LIL6_9HYPH|nr:hypothetical protein [Sinorhizobium americanum]APG89939.1 hypothetical protein SAMCFNEI73_Ch0613 [Sinorhizobium americanum]
MLIRAADMVAERLSRLDVELRTRHCDLQYFKRIALGVTRASRVPAFELLPELFPIFEPAGL